MRKSTIYLVLTSVAVAAAILATLLGTSRKPADPTSALNPSLPKDAPPGRVTIEYPLD